MSIGIFMMPESPRFLASKGRFDEARAWLVKYHGNGNPDDELVKFEYQEMLAGMAQDEKAKGALWRNLLKSKPNRQRMWLAAMFTMIPQWSGGAIIKHVQLSLHLQAHTADLGRTGRMALRILPRLLRLPYLH